MTDEHTEKALTGCCPNCKRPTDFCDCSVERLRAAIRATEQRIWLKAAADLEKWAAQVFNNQSPTIEAIWAFAGALRARADEDAPTPQPRRG